MSDRGQFEERGEPGAWRELAASFRRGLEGTEGEMAPFGLATAVVARWREERCPGGWEYGALEWLSIRMAMVSAAASLLAWGGWLWTSGGDLGEEWVELPPMEEVIWE